LKQIIELQLVEVAKRLSERKIEVVFTDKAKELISEKGYDPAYGARPLKRAIQDLILDELSLMIIEGKIQEGAKIQVDAKQNKIVIATSN